MMIESDIFKNDDEKINYLLNKDFSNNEYVKKNHFSNQSFDQIIEKWLLDSKTIYS